MNLSGEPGTLVLAGLISKLLSTIEANRCPLQRMKNGPAHKDSIGGLFVVLEIVILYHDSRLKLVYKELKTDFLVMKMRLNYLITINFR